MRRYGWDYADDVRFRRRSSDRARERAAAWLADPVGGRVGYDRFYGEPRGPRYGERYDFGFAPLSEMNPISRELRREYHGLAPNGSRGRPPRYDRGW